MGLASYSPIPILFLESMKVSGIKSAERKKFRRILESAQKVTALTGAGISAESGIPTFRDRGGIWEKFDPQQVATLEAFHRDPKFVWEWYALRMKACAHARPNAGHQALAELERRIPEFWLITQNIDNLHYEAGSRRLTELHGNIWRTRCLKCGSKERLKAIPENFPPRCSHCEGLLRPDIVWFGELLDPANVAQAEAACETDVMLIIGTSGEVWPAAGFAHQAKNSGAFLIEINTQPTALTEIADLALHGKSGEILQQNLGDEAGGNNWGKLREKI
jgi:NAD-dependent deacetylase